MEDTIIELNEEQESRLVLKQLGDRMAAALYSDACQDRICRNKDLTRMIPVDEAAQQIHDDRYNKKYHRR